MEGFIRDQPKPMQQWTWSQFHTYVKLKEGTDIADLESKTRRLWLCGIRQRSEADLCRALMPIEKIHLYAYDQLWDIAVRGNVQTVYILSANSDLYLDYCYTQLC